MLMLNTQQKQRKRNHPKIKGKESNQNRSHNQNHTTTTTTLFISFKVSQTECVCPKRRRVIRVAKWYQSVVKCTTFRITNIYICWCLLLFLVIFIYNTNPQVALFQPVQVETNHPANTDYSHCVSDSEKIPIAICKCKLNMYYILHNYKYFLFG